MYIGFLKGSAAAAVVLSCLAGAAPAHAQEEDAQLWTSATADFELGEDTNFTSQAVARFSDAAEGLAERQLQVDLETGVGGALRVGGGYSYVTRYEDGELASREHRVRQQVSAELGEVLGGRIEGRLRLEQRWRDDGDDVMLRLRPRLSWAREIGRDDLELRLWHESFIQLNDTDWGGEAGYARLRNQVSLRRSLAKSVAGEVGYLSQYSLSGQGPDELVHALTVAISFSL
jgi:hypothetical protein